MAHSGEEHERTYKGNTGNDWMLPAGSADRRDGDPMIKITWYSISLGADINTYSDGDWDMDHLYVLDSKGGIYEELPAHMLTGRADIEIAALIQEALDQRLSDYNRGLI